MRVVRLARIAALAAFSLASFAASAQAWPARPIRWIVPYPPGGITDSATRMVLQKVQEQTGWTLIVDNRPGANSMLGADLAAKAAPDGYTFLTVIAGHAANATLYQGRMPFDAVKSFAPVSLVGIAPLIMTASNAFPPKNVKDLIAYAKANPGKISYGSSGVGAAAHLTTELFKQTTGTYMVHIPYRGTAPATQDLIGGAIQILVDTPSSMMPQVRAGKIKAMGIFSAKRLPAFPEVPTIAEAGGPLIESSTWVMFLAPAAVPREIVNRLSAEVGKAVRSPDIKAKFEALGIEPSGNSPDQAAKFLGDEVAKWRKVITNAGVKAE